MRRLNQLQDAGVSIWLDTLSRELLDSGAFAGLIADSAVTGATTVTSRPRCLAEAATSAPIQPAPTTTTVPPPSSRSRNASESATLRR